MGETDFHSMKRKELQALCKQHNIRANSTNLEMANNLTQIFKEKESQIIETVEVSAETESINVLVSKKVKKVRFSPENELIEFTRSHKTKRSRSSIVLTKTSNLSVDNVNCAQELNGDNVDRPVRMRLRGKTVVENVDIVNKRGRKKVIVDDKSESVGKIEDKLVGMQLRGKTLKENVDNVSKGGRKRVIVDKVENQDGVGNDENGVGNRRSLMNKGAVSDGNLSIGMEVKNNEKAKEEALVEPQDLVRRSKRRVSTVSSSKMVVESTKVGGFVTARSEVETGVQNHESVKVELRRSRRKSVLPSREQRNLEPEPRSEKVDMPGKVVNTSKRKNLDLNPVSSMIETKEHFVKPCLIAQNNTRRSKRNASHSVEVSDEFGGDDIIQRKNETRKKKKVNVSKEVVIDDSCHNTQSTLGVSDAKKPSSTMKESTFLEGSLQDGVTEHREPLAAQLSVPEVTGVSEQKLLSESTETTELNREIQDNSIVNSIALTDMDENGPSRMKDVHCENDFPEMVVEKAHLTLEADVQLLNEENIIVADNDDAAAQMTSHTEISTFHANCEEVTENSNVCENEESPKNSLLAGAFTFDDQTDLKIDLEGIEAEAEEYNGPKADILDLVSEHNGVCAQENPGPVEPEFINDVSLPLGCKHSTDMELLVASSPCHGTATEKAHNFTPMRCSEIENTQTEYDLNDVNCLKESNVSPDLSNEDTAELSGALKNSSGYDTLVDQCQSDDKDGVAETSEEKLLPSNITGDNMSMEKTIIGAEHKATKQAEEISNGYTSTLADNWNCSKENEDSIEAVNAEVGSFCDTVIPELELGRRLSEGNFPEIMVVEIQNGQIGTEDNITLNGPNEDSCQGTKMSNLETSMNKSTVTRGVCSSIQNEELNMDVEEESEWVNSINKSSLSEQEENELPVKFEASSVVDEASGSESILRNKTCDEDICSVEDNIVIENKELHEDGEKENECEKSLNESSVSEREEHVLQSPFAMPIKSVDSCMVDEASGSESILKATSSKDVVCTVKEDVVIETISSDRIERGRGMEFEKVITESLIFEATDHEVLDARCIAGMDETDLRLLFATPNKKEASNKVDEFCRSESKLEESCLEKVYSAKQKASHDKVGDAAYHDDTECIARNDESDLQLLFTTPNKSFSCEANKIRGSESKHALEECTVEKVCPMKQNAFHEEVGVAGFELTNSLSPEAPNTEALVDADFLDNLVCAPESRVSCGEELPQSSENFDTGSQNQIQVSVATLSDNLNHSREKEESVDERTVDVELCIDEAIEKLEATSLSEWKFHDTVGTEIQDQDLLGCNIMTNVDGKIFEEESGQNRQGTDHEVLDARCIAGAGETDLRLLFATPNKTEASYKVDEVCRSENKLEESCLEKVCSAKQKTSHDKVGEAGYHDDTECIARNDESDLQLLFTTPNKSFSCEDNKIRGSKSKHALEECTVEKVCPMKQNTSHEEVGVAGFELTNSLSPEVPNTEALVDADFLDNLACANESRVNRGEELAQSSENFDTGPQNQIQVSIATLSDNPNRSREKESVDERTADVELCTDANEKLEVTSLSEERFHDTVVTEIQDQDLLGCNITTNVGGKLSEEVLGQNRQENELLFLFSTPNKSEASREANETRRSETKLQESCIEKASCDKVGDAISDHEVLSADCIAEQYEIDLQLPFATPSKIEAFRASECKLEESCMEKEVPNDESMKDEDLNLVSGLELENLDSSTVLPVIFEASKENWTGETYEQNKGTSSLSVEHILSSGQTCFDEEPKDDDQDSAEIISTMASPLKTRNESCDEKLLDIESAENLKLAQINELRSGFANGDTILKCSNDSGNNHYFAAYSQGSNIKRVTSTDAFLEPSSSEMANGESDKGELFSSDKFQNEIDSRFEILKQSDVMETIQEYTNYESSNSIDIDRSGVTLPIKASTEASKISCSVDELHEASILDEVSVLRQVSTAKKAVRTILIHGAPNKALVMVDMKENDPLKKKPLIGDITIARLAKRRALQDIEYK